MSAPDAIQAAARVDDVIRRGFTRVALLADTTGYGKGGFNDIERFLASGTAARCGSSRPRTRSAPA